MKVRLKKSNISSTRTSAPNNASAENNCLLRLEAVSKSFPGTRALNEVNFNVNTGEVHALFGENGAGKSTLIQIIAGDLQPSSGNIYLNNEPLKIRSVHHARELGICTVFQEFSLIPQLSVEENLYLGSEAHAGPFLQKSVLHEHACAVLKRLGFDLDPKMKVLYLSRAEQQMVEIAKAFRSRPTIMILDEPTASLTEHEANKLFTMVDALKKEGIGVIFITHRVSEIYRICDRVTVLRDGHCVTSVPVSKTSEEQLVALAIGRQIKTIFPKINTKPGRLLLNISHLHLQGGSKVNDVSLNVRAGEVVGLAGLVGSGKSEVGRVCFGLNKITSGRISYLDDDVFDSTVKTNFLSPRAMLDRGMLYLPSDRRAEGLVMMQNVRENVSLPSLGLAKFSSGFLLHKKNEREIVTQVLRRLGLNKNSIERPLEHLSGGNQQKILVARSLVRDIKMFILDEPTVGVDVGARAAIYRLIRDVCNAGAGVLLISSDASEVVNMAHRTYVMHRGSLRAELSQSEISTEKLLEYIFKMQESDSCVPDRVN